MSNSPTVTINGGPTCTLYDEEDVKTVFESETPFEPGEHIEEWVVDTIDYELDYILSRDEYVLRAYVYFTGTTPDGGGSISEEVLHLSGWGRTGNIITSEGIGIVYERRAY